MKTLILILVCSLMMFNTFSQTTTSKIAGAWQTGTDVTETMIITEQHFVIARYNVAEKKFISTAGGKYAWDGSRMTWTMEFNTARPEAVGTTLTINAELKDDKLVVADQEWKRIDDSTPGKLAGAWLITGRKVDDNMQTITPGARRTMKILSGTRFQWIAYNAETKEFSGTGGGTYTTKDGKYVENIEFFSRDESRVGASLTFDFELKEGNWHHSGLSSKGDPINEVWTKREKVGL